MLGRRPLDGGVPHKGWLAALNSALVDGGLPVAGLDADPPRPRVILGVPLPPGVPGERELVDLHLVERVPAWRVRELVRDALDGGDVLVDCYDVWLGEPPLPGRITGAAYRGTLLSESGAAAEVAGLREAADAMLAATTLPRARRKGEISVDYDLRPFLVSLSIEVPSAGTCVLRCVVRHDPEKGIGRPEEVVAELQDRINRPLHVTDLCRERLLLADELPPRATAPPATGTARPRAGATGSRAISRRSPVR